jgi:very-short-patch-repair endonuclease
MIIGEEDGGHGEASSYPGVRENPTAFGGQPGFDGVMHSYDRHLKQHSRRLRQDMTDAESRLWWYLRRKRMAGVQVYRQKPLGKYIVDFFAPRVDLVIEVDGGQHFTEAGLRNDGLRDDALRAMGLQVLRYDNLQVLQHTEAVVDDILRHVMGRLR